MRATAAITGSLALVIMAGAIVAGINGAVGLAVAATAVLVLLVTALCGLFLIQLRRAHQRLTRTVSSVQQTVDTLSREVRKRARALTQTSDHVDAIRTDLRGVLRETERTRTQTRELLESQEFRIGAQLAGQEDRRCDRQCAAEDSPAAADAAAAVQLVTLYRPLAPIAPSGPAPSQVLALLLISLDLEPERVLALDCGEQVLWLAYALPTAQIVVPVPAEHERALRSAIVRHGVTERVQVVPVSARPPNLAHYYDSWYDPDGITGPVDLIVLGNGRRAAYPALPLLGGLLTPDGVLVLPDCDDSPIAVWCAEDLAEIDEALSVPPAVALRLTPEGRRKSVP